MKWARLLLLVVLPVLIYLPALPAPFHYDDWHSIANNPHLHLGNAGRFFVDPGLFDRDPSTRMYRPVLLLTYAVDDLFWGRNPWGFHLTNLLLHVLAGAALFVLLEALVKNEGRGVRRGGPLVGTLVFLVHPLASETVVYVSCRSSLLATFGYLGALAAYVQARTRARGGRAAARYLAALGLALVALGSKAIAVTLPASLILLEGLVVEPHLGGWRRLRRLAARVTPFVLLAGLYLAVRSEVMGRTGIDLSVRRFVEGGHALTGGRSILANLLTQAGVFWRYVALVLWPVDLSIAHHVEVVEQAGSGRFLVPALGLGAYAAAALTLVRRHRLLAAGLLWLPLTLSPTSTIVPLNVVMNEHRMYLPLTLCLAALVVGIGRVLRGRARRAAPVAVALLVVVWGGRTLWRATDYTSEETLWRQAATLAPGSYRARLYYGNVCAKRGDLLAAREEYRAALVLYPESVDTRINLGEVNLRIAAQGLDPGAWSLAEAHLRRVVEREPRHVLARLKLGRHLFNRARSPARRPADLAAATEQFVTVAKLATSPRFREARYFALVRLADVKEYAHDARGAIEALERVLQMYPLHASTHRRLASLYERLGRADLARRHHARAALMQKIQ